VSLENTENAPPASIAEIQHSRTSATLTLSAEDITPATKPDATKNSQHPPKASSFWYRYPGFEPDPRAPFKLELGRLCKHVGARTKKEKKDLQTEALTAEIKFHYGSSMSRLDRWQELCEEVGIEKIPTSITQCQKVCIACPANRPRSRRLLSTADFHQVLKPIFINLFNLVDHRRNPELKVLRFQSYGEFNEFTRKGHEFPRNCAKQEGFIKVLLKKM
jgi:hypothetical protein